MFNFLFNRAGVKACLIAAMVLQPLAVVAGQAGFLNAPCEMVSGSLGGSRVAAGECCKAEVGKTCCCTKGRFVSDKPKAKSCCATGFSKRTSVEALTSTSSVGKVCTCAVSPAPAIPLAEPPATHQVRSIELAFFVCLLDFAYANTKHPQASNDGRADRSIPAHFVQRVLCIWRI